MDAFNPLPRAKPGQRVGLSAEVWNQLCDMVERSLKMSVAPPLSLEIGPTGKHLSMRLPPGAKQAVLTRITGFNTPAILGAGKYWGYMQTRTATAWTYANALDLNTFYDDDTTTGLCLIINPIESGETGHVVAANSFNYGIKTGQTALVGLINYPVIELIFGMSWAC